MFPRLGLRSRILALTMPIVILVSAGTAGIIYLSLGQVLEASARDIAASEAAEVRADLQLHSIERARGDPRGRRREPGLPGRRRHRCGRHDHRQGGHHADGRPRGPPGGAEGRHGRRRSRAGPTRASRWPPPMRPASTAVATRCWSPWPPRSRARRWAARPSSRSSAPSGSWCSSVRSPPSPSVRHCAPSSGCATRSRASPRRVRPRSSRSPRAATSCPSWPRRSTRCSTGCDAPTTHVGRSWRMRGTSCEARSPR